MVVVSFHKMLEAGRQWSRDLMLSRKFKYSFVREKSFFLDEKSRTILTRNKIVVVVIV